ncbi:MAG: HAMP domain-containing protein, partial [Candidatus Xenobia bacterium]
MSRGRLSLRLTIAVGLLLLAVGGVNLYLLDGHERGILRNETSMRAQALARILALQASYALETDNPGLLQSYVNQQFLAQDVRHLVVLDPGGRILASDDPTMNGQQNSDPWVLGHARTSAAWRLVEHEMQVVEPVRINGDRVATVCLDLSLAPLGQALLNAQAWLLGSTAIFFILALGTVAALATYFVRPIRTISDVAGRLGGGDLSGRAPIVARDEVGRLARAFNDMASQLQGLVAREREKHQALQQRVSEMLSLTDRIAAGDLRPRADLEGEDEMARIAAGFNAMVDRLSQLMAGERQMREDLECSKARLEAIHHDLQEVDRQKSDFLNVVSHELRTPLTSIKAFSELLLDNPQEDPEIQGEFLGILQQETERLTHLI